MTVVRGTKKGRPLQRRIIKGQGHFQHKRTTSLLKKATSAVICRAMALQSQWIYVTLHPLLLVNSEEERVTFSLCAAIPAADTLEVTAEGESLCNFFFFFFSTNIVSSCQMLGVM